MILEDMKSKLLEDPQNDIVNFYKILDIDQSRTKKNAKNNFKSTHVISDLAQIRGTKFYKAKPLSEFEQIVRQRIDKENGKTLLMSEV